MRDVAWSPTVLQRSYIASASQDKTVRIWTHTPSTNQGSNGHAAAAADPSPNDHHQESSQPSSAAGTTTAAAGGVGSTPTSNHNQQQAQSTGQPTGQPTTTIGNQTGRGSDHEEWISTTLSFDAVVWRVSWSLSGNILAVSGGDNKVSLWKENLKGIWECVQTIDE